MLSRFAFIGVALAAICAVFLYVFQSNQPPTASIEPPEVGQEMDKGEAEEMAAPPPRPELVENPNPQVVPMGGSEEVVIAEPLIITRDDLDEDDGYSHVTLYFATNRSRVDGTTMDDLTKQFADVNAAKVTYGLAEVSIPDSHQPGQIESQNRIVAWFLPPNPEKHVILQQMEPMDQQRFEMLIRGTLQTEDAILMYVHGFNTSMEKAARRSGQLTYDLGWNGPSMFFSWPSQGSAAAYTIDANMAQRSERALVEVLEVLAGTQADRIVIIAHSMGTQLLTQSLLRLDPDVRNRIDTIILAAPDIDVDVFENDILPVFREMDETEVTLYASSEDTALKMSHTVNGFTRIGDTVNGIRPLDPVKVIDATGAVSDFFGHTYFGDNPTIVDDIRVLVRDNLAPADRTTLAGVPEPHGPTWKIVLPD